MQENKEELENIPDSELNYIESSNENKQNKEESSSNIDTTAIWSIIILLVIAFFFSLYYKLRKEKIEYRLNKLNKLIQQREIKKAKLDRYFKVAYFVTRLLLVLSFICIDILLWHFGFIKELKDVNTWNALIITFLITVNFIIFGSLTNLEKMINWIEKVVRRIIYKRNINIGDKIDKSKQEKADAEKELNQLANGNS